MEEIKITYDKNHEQSVVSSLQVANDFWKQHKHVLDAIENIIDGVAENSADLFYKSEYIHPQNKQHYPMYLMNRDGFSLLVMGFTGKDALEWKLKYIQAFNKMEAKLKSLPSDDKKSKEIDAKFMNAKARVASIWLKIAEKVPSNKEYQQICGAYASEALTGQKVLPLPQCDEKHYNATEVGAILGITANAVGRLANKHNLKTNENGKLFFDKSKSSNKEVEIFKYNENGIEAIRKVMGGKK